MPKTNIKKGPILLSALLAFSTTACSTAFEQEVRNTDGPFEFAELLAGKSFDNALPVERVDGNLGQIETAYVQARPSGFFVRGWVSKRRFDPPPDSHVDVVLVDAKMRVIESVATPYQPTIMPPRLHGGLPESHYSAWLRTLHPPPGSRVRVIFHDGPENASSLH